MFEYTTDAAAFVDRILLNVWSPEVNARSVGGKLENEKNTPILGKGKAFSRCISGKCKLTCNPIAIVYGRTIRFRNVPLAQVSFRSEAVPLTGAQVVFAMTNLFGIGAHIDISLLELTFDTKGTRWWRLREEVVHRARNWRVLSDVGGRRTLYIGSRASDAQVRIYQKTDSVVRCEFVLRRGYLRSCGIIHPLDVVRLRSGQVWRLLSLRTCSAARVCAATASWRNQTGREILREWRERKLPSQLLASILRKGRVDPSSVLIKSHRQRSFETMLQKLIW